MKSTNNNFKRTETLPFVFGHTTQGLTENTPALNLIALGGKRPSKVSYTGDCYYALQRIANSVVSRDQEACLYVELRKGQRIKYGNEISLFVYGDIPTNNYCLPSEPFFIVKQYFDLPDNTNILQSIGSFHASMKKVRKLYTGGTIFTAPATGLLEKPSFNDYWRYTLEYLYRFHYVQPHIEKIFNTKKEAYGIRLIHWSGN